MDCCSISILKQRGESLCLTIWCCVAQIFLTEVNTVHINQALGFVSCQRDTAWSPLCFVAMGTYLSLLNILWKYLNTCNTLDCVCILLIPGLPILAVYFLALVKVASLISLIPNPCMAYNINSAGQRKQGFFSPADLCAWVLLSRPLTWDGEEKIYTCFIQGRFFFSLERSWSKLLGTSALRARLTFRLHSDLDFCFAKDQFWKAIVKIAPGWNRQASYQFHIAHHWATALEGSGQVDCQTNQSIYFALQLHCLPRCMVQR